MNASPSSFFKLQNVVVPRRYEAEPLYLRGQGALDYDRETGEVRIQPDQTVSFDTYFNALFEAHLARVAGVRSVTLCLKTSGTLALRVGRRTHHAGDQTIARRILSGDLLHTLHVEIPPEEPLQGRLYFELTGVGEGGSLLQGQFTVPSNAVVREVHLDVVTCTFKREKDVTRTVAELLGLKDLQPCLHRIIVVDNARTLRPEDFSSPRAILIGQDNFGGAGGFTRGLLESLDDPRSTHFLFMDDDIELDAESVFRACAYLAIMTGTHAIAGGMLDQLRRTHLVEAGARWPERRPFSVEPLYGDLDLAEKKPLDSLHAVKQSDWGAWWFLAAPKSVAKQVGLGFPLFIRGDDIEYGLRLNERGIRSWAIPGIAVWHQPFYMKTGGWPIYYDHRNFLINNALHEQYPPSQVLRTLAERVTTELLRYDYQNASLIIEAIKDYQRGPARALADPVANHQKIIDLTKRNAPERCDWEGSVTPLRRLPMPLSVLRKMRQLLTLGGHVAHTDARMPAVPQRVVLPWDHRWDTARDGVMAVKHPWIPGVQVYRRDPKRFWHLSWEALRSGAALALRYGTLGRGWRDRAATLTTADAWREYLGLHGDLIATEIARGPAKKAGGRP